MTNKKHDQSLDVNEALTQSEAFVVSNKKNIITAVVALVLLIGAYFAYIHLYANPRETKASTILAQGQELFKMNNYDKALNGDGQSFIGLIQLANQYSGTDAANLANLYAGLSFAQQGKYAEAIKYLEEFDSKDDAMISPAALGALGNCYASNGQLDKAVATLKEAAMSADNHTLSPIYLLQAGQILESQDKKEEAKSLYEEIKNKYYRSYAAQSIDKYIERASQK